MINFFFLLLRVQEKSVMLMGHNRYYTSSGNVLRLKYNKREYVKLYLIIIVVVVNIYRVG